MQSSILPSMIAGIFALIALHITKRNKVSEFRQAWIDAIRQELSEFCSNARALGSLLDQGQGLVSERKAREEQMQKVKRLLASEDDAFRTAIGEEHRAQLQKLIDFEVEVDRKLDPCLEKCRTNYYKIRLRLNLAEEEVAPDPLHVQMEERLRAIIEVLGRGLQQETFRYDDLLKDIDALLAVSSRMLKHEWERVKAGDFQHRVLAAYRRLGSASLTIVRND